MRMRKNASAKLDAICELVSTCMDESKKVLVFSQFTSFLDLIGTRLAEQGVDFYTITGETPKKRRVELVDDSMATMFPCSSSRSKRAIRG